MASNDTLNPDGLRYNDGKLVRTSIGFAGSKRKREDRDDKAPGDDRPLKVRVAAQVDALRSTDRDGNPVKYNTLWLPITVLQEVIGAVTSSVTSCITADDEPAPAAEELEPAAGAGSSAPPQ